MGTPDDCAPNNFAHLKEASIMFSGVTLILLSAGLILGRGGVVKLPGCELSSLSSVQVDTSCGLSRNKAPVVITLNPGDALQTWLPDERSRVRVYNRLLRSIYNCTFSALPGVTGCHWRRGSPTRSCSERSSLECNSRPPCLY